MEPRNLCYYGEILKEEEEEEEDEEEEDDDDDETGCKRTLKKICGTVIQRNITI